MARPAGLEPATLGLAYHFCFRSRRQSRQSSWSGLSLRHLRRRTYSLYGSRQCRFPRDYQRRDPLRLPRYSAVHSDGSTIPAEGSFNSKADALSA